MHFESRSPQLVCRSKRLVSAYRFVFFLGLFVAAASLGSRASAQMIRSSLPFTRINNSFYERIGIDFGFSLRGSSGNPFNDNARGVFGLGPGGQLQPNLTFSQGGVNSAVPPFGGYDPNADATFGYNVRNSQGGYHLGFRLGKGSNRSIVNTTPVLMTRNGYPGSLFDGTANPFVTGIVPVVGGGGYALPDLGRVEYSHPLEMKLRQLHMEQQAGLASSTASGSSTARQSSNQGNSNQSSANSTANRGDLSVKEIKRLRKQQKEAASNESAEKVNGLIAKAESAIANGKTGAARSYLRTAIRYSSGNQKAQLESKLEELMDR